MKLHVAISITITAGADGWEIRLTHPDRTYSTQRDRAGVLRETGDRLLDPQDTSETGMALSILAESLDDVSDALWRAAQGGE